MRDKQQMKYFKYYPEMAFYFLVKKKNLSFCDMVTPE